MFFNRRTWSDEDERLHLVGCRTYMFARPVPLKQNPKVSRGVEAPRGRSRRLMSLSCGDVPYRLTTDFGAQPTCRSSRARDHRRRTSRTKRARRSRSSDASDALLLLSSQTSRQNGASKSREQTRARRRSLFSYDETVTFSGRHIRQLRADPIPRRGVRRPAERHVLILVRREKGTYYPRFDAALLGNGAETLSFCFLST